MMVHYPIQLDEIDQWLVDNFDIIPGACSSTENLRYNTARMIAEALWPKNNELQELNEAAEEFATVKDAYGNNILDSELMFAFKAGAKWGEKNAYKTIIKKADEVRDKRFDTDYEVKFEPAAGFDLGCVNVYHEGKLVGQYVEPKEEKKLSESLDEVAKQYAEKHGFRIPYDGSNNFYDDVDVKASLDGFKAGAKWQAEQMKKEATEVTVYEDAGGYPQIPIIELYDYDNDKPLAKKGDKVKVYIFKN